MKVTTSITNCFYGLLLCASSVVAIGMGGYWDNRHDAETIHLLAQSGPVQQWQDRLASDNRSVLTRNEHPLVTQAKAYAALLNPPKPPRSTTKAKKVQPVPAPPQTRPTRSTPKFRVLATSVHRTLPHRSIALISEPGKDPRWVRQGQPIGYLIIRDIKVGSVVYQDGESLDELAMAPSQDNPVRDGTNPGSSQGYANKQVPVSGREGRRALDSQAKGPGGQRAVQVSRVMTPLSPRFGQ